MADRSPTAWRDLLERRLHNRWADWKQYDDAYEGDHPLSAWLRSVQRAFQGTVLGYLLNDLVDNYMPLVVDSTAERLKINGFRIDGANEASPEAADIWKANGLKSQSNMVHTESIKLGEAYWLVGPDGQVTCEHPSQVIVATAPGNRRARLAALKKWCDDDGFAYANLYLPEGVVKWRAPTSRAATTQGLQWVEIDRFSHDFGAVPIVPVPNNPSMLKGGRSDLAFGATSLQNAIEKSVADILIGSEYHGLPQRVLLGVEAPRNPETGRVIPFEDAAKSRLWYFNSPDAKAHEFSQADLKGLRETVDGFIGDLAAQTRIPIYYFRPQAISNISAEALIGLDAGLVSKAKDKEDPFEEGHNEMMRLAFKAKGQDVEVETLWANTESRSVAQVVDAAVKKQTIGVPFEQLAEDIGYTPEQIDSMQTARDEEGLLLQAPETPPVSTNGSVPAVAPAN